MTPDERETLRAMLALLIPADELGPGAAEAGGVEFVERALDGELAHLRGAYAEGLAALDALARTQSGARFAGLDAGAQDELLRSLEGERFFELVRLHAIHGFFADPSHGGNAGGAGWELLGFPGPRGTFTEDDQRIARG